MHVVDWLADRFVLPTENEVDCRVELRWDEHSVCFQIDDGGLRVVEERSPHFSILFDSENTMRAMLQGRLNPMHAFSEGKFRSTGYIVWTFRVLAMFTRSD